MLLAPGRYRPMSHRESPGAEAAEIQRYSAIAAMSVAMSRSAKDVTYSPNGAPQLLRHLDDGDWCRHAPAGGIDEQAIATGGDIERHLQSQPPAHDGVTPDAPAHTVWPSADVSEARNGTPSSCGTCTVRTSPTANTLVAAGIGVAHRCSPARRRTRSASIPATQRRRTSPGLVSQRERRIRGINGAASPGYSVEGRDAGADGVPAAASPPTDS